jgi:hypothetical protein
MAPAAVSTAIVFGLLVPAFWLFEPRAAVEEPGLLLGAFVLVAGALVASGLYRVVVASYETRRLERRWRRAAGSATSGLPIRAFYVPSAMPLAALVGVVRPRLFVSEPFLAALSEGERSAVLDHEAAHRVSLDNLKRTLMRLAPDWLAFFPVGRDIEAAWAMAAEDEADDHAVGTDRARSLDLAGALLKAARLTPVRCAPASNLYDGATVARRVSRLLGDEPVGRISSRRLEPRVAGVVALAVLAAALLSGHALQAAYATTEAAIRLLR